MLKYLYNFKSFNETNDNDYILDDVYTFINGHGETREDPEVLQFLSKYLKQSAYWFFEDKLNIDITRKNYKILPNIINMLEAKYKYYLSYLRGDMSDDIDSEEFIEFKKHIKYNLEEIIKDIHEGEDDDFSFYTLIFEPIHSDIDTNIPDILYHITDKNNLTKIKKLGLLPKDNAKLTLHPQRVYLLKNEKDSEDLLRHSKFTIDHPYLLTIDVSSFKNNLKFYTDINYPKGVYITKNIDPKYIIGYKEL